MKKKYFYSSLGSFKGWQNADNLAEVFTEYNFRFTRPLTPKERNEAVYHFLAGLVELDGLHLYAIHSVDFLEVDKLQLNFRNIAVDRNRILFQLMVKFKERFPVQPAKERRCGELTECTKSA
jgi:hypothetical protein